MYLCDVCSLILIEPRTNEIKGRKRDNYVTLVTFAPLRERETPNDTKERGALGPFHTRAKSRDHEIVRAQKKVFKCRPNSPPKSCSVVTDPEV